jgi:basic amino acid/polyamine antiporter, APA family
VAQTSQGLVRTIGRWSLTALMVNSILGVSIFRLPADLAARMGWLSPLGCLASGAGILIVAGCIAEVSSRYGETGGLYLYARDALGRFAGLLVGWLISLTRIAAPAAGANLFCSYAAQFVPWFGTRSGEILVLALLVGHLAVLNYIGVKTGKHVSNAFTLVKVSFFLFFVFAGVAALLLKPEVRVPFSLPSVSAKNWLEAMLLMVFAYGGFEGALFLGGESTNPRRDTPVALLAALVIVCGVYTAVQIVVVGLLPDASSTLTPLSDAARRFLGNGGAMAIALAALVSVYGYLSANLLHGPRILFALGEQGDFPGQLSRVHDKFRTPHVSIILYATLVFLLAVLGNFEWNAILSAVARLTVYGAMALAVPVFRMRKDGKAKFLLPVPYLFSGFGILFSVALLTRMGRGEFIVVAATCGIALINWLVVRRR